jgi:cullin-associated NEDD8-dissociated protein 1
MTVASFSTSGAPFWSMGQKTRTEAISPKTGPAKIVDFDSYRLLISNITLRRQKNIYAEEYNRQFLLHAEESNNLADLMEGLTLSKENDWDMTNEVQAQLYQVAKLIKLRTARKAERDFFYISMSGFDMHNEVIADLRDKMEKLDGSLKLFVDEMKQQNIFNSVTVVTGSDFGRTLASNGKGSDHAWAGNTLAVGGALKGGQIFNKFPSTLELDSHLDIGRGRLIPSYPWESQWYPIMKWMGVEDANIDDVLPNLRNFPGELIPNAAKLFK